MPHGTAYDVLAAEGMVCQHALSMCCLLYQSSLVLDMSSVHPAHMFPQDDMAHGWEHHHHEIIIPRVGISGTQYCTSAVLQM